MSLSEILVILLIALLVIKPEQLPDVAYSLGTFFCSIRKFFTNIKQEFHQMMTSLEERNERKDK